VIIGQLPTFNAGVAVKSRIVFVAVGLNGLIVKVKFYNKATLRMAGTTNNVLPPISFATLSLIHSHIFFLLVRKQQRRRQKHRRDCPLPHY
jgi:hypothetical protein